MADHIECVDSDAELNTIWSLIGFEVAFALIQPSKHEQSITNILAKKLVVVRLFKI